jgi:hypothetical protein
VRTAPDTLSASHMATLYTIIGEEPRRLHHVFKDDLERLHHAQPVPTRAEQRERGASQGTPGHQPQINRRHRVPIY